MKDSATINRRNFIRLTVCTSVAVPFIGGSLAHAGGHLPKLEESDPQATGLGYKHDTTQVDAAKFAQHNPEQKCLNCSLYTGKDGDAWGPCAIFPGKEVAAEGWCSAYNPKA